MRIKGFFDLSKQISTPSDMLSHFIPVWLCYPMDQIPRGSSVHGILQAIILEWVAISSCRGSSQPRDQTCISYLSYFLGRNVCASIKKAEHQRIDAFELCCWRTLLRVPWTARRSNQSILKVISPEYSLEGLMLKLKLQYFGTWCEKLTHWKDPDARKDGRQEEKGKAEDEMVGWHHQLNGQEFE